MSNGINSVVYMCLGTLVIVYLTYRGKGRGEAKHMNVVYDLRGVWGYNPQKRRRRLDLDIIV